MQYRILRRVVLSFAVMIVAVGSLTLLGCGGDDNETRVVSQTIPLDAANAAAGNTEVVEGRSFAVSGDTLAAGTTTPAVQQALRGTQPTLGFSNINNATGNFSLTNPTASGTVRFASCTFTITAPAALAGSTIFIQNCTVFVTSGGVEVELGGDAVAGSVTLNLNGSVSSVSSAQVSLTDDGQLIVDGVPITITATGASGG